MACMTSLTSSTTTTTTTSFEEPIFTGGRPKEGNRLRQRRRHSSYHTQPWTYDQENIQLMVDHFLTELGRRLDFLESYGHLNFDAGIERAYSTLLQVREACSHVGNDVIDAGRRRGKIMVDTLEEQYKGALARKETMEQKVQEGVRLMENMMEEFETRAYALRDSRLAQAGELLDFGWKRFDHGMEKAREVVDEGFEKARRAREALRVKIDHAVKRAREHGLIKYEDLPDPWKVNPHILRGYRFSETPIECMKSIIGVSNEMFNIWSHLIGSVIILTLALYIYPSSANFSSSSKTDILVAGIFFIAACKCLVCSTLWHTMSSISSQTLMERFACVDYTGISLLVATSIMTTEYTAFYCEPVSRWVYMVITGILGVLGTMAAWHPYFNRADVAWLRVIFYVTLSLTGFLPFFQLSYTRGLDWATYFYAPIAKSIFVYFAGAVMYASQVPERWFPGAFDYVGGSHNIWHVAVLGGILFHYMAMQEFFRMAFERVGEKGTCSLY